MSSNQASSMRALLESLTASAEKVSNEKESADDIKQAPAQPLDPGTAASELADDPSKNESVVCGERAAEHDANINDTLGAQAAVNSAGPVHASDDQQVAPAADVAKATEDPESQERSAVAPVAELEPGTEAAELKLSVEDWTKQAADLLVDLTVAAKVASEKEDDKEDDKEDEVKEDDKADDDEESKEAEDVKSDDRPAAGEEAEEPTPEPKVEEEGEGNKEADPGTAQKESEDQDPCDVLAGGNKEAAEELRSLIHHQLTDAVSYGAKLAADTLSFLEVAREEKEAMYGMEGAPVEAAPAPIEDAPIEEAPMEEVPAELPMEEGGEELAEDPELIEEALTELAAEMGVAPEELGQLLAGAGEDAGPAVDEGAIAAEEAMAGKEAAAQAEFGFKVAAAKSAIKKDALELLAETVARGRR